MGYRVEGLNFHRVSSELGAGSSQPHRDDDDHPGPRPGFAGHVVVCKVVCPLGLEGREQYVLHASSYIRSGLRSYAVLVRSAGRWLMAGLRRRQSRDMGKIFQELR
jgi:hypothetical protein